VQVRARELPGDARSRPVDAAPAAGGHGLRDDVVLTLVAKLSVLALGAATTVILARALGPSGRGALAATVALMTLLVQLGTLGIASANPYFAAREPAARARIAGNSLWLAAIVGSLMATAGVALKAFVPGSLADVSWAQLALGMVAVPFALCSVFMQNIALGEGRISLYNGVEVGSGALTVALIATVFQLAGGGVLLALALMLAPQLAALAVYASAASRHGRILRRPDRALARRMLGYGARAYVITLLAFMLIRFDLLLVNGIQGSRAAGQYSIAVALADALYLLPAAVALNLFARVARGAADRNVSLAVFQLVAVGYLLVCAVAAAAAGPVIALLFGSNYRPAASLFLWLLPGVYCLGVLEVLANHFAAHGMPRELVLAWLPGLLVNLAVNLVLLPSHGTYVASIASSVAYAIVLCLHLRLFAREFGGWASLRPTVAGTGSLLRTVVRRV
jgi:O-antigen/teichoic acid export membrane protein